jgi:hypothetical protein
MATKSRVPSISAALLDTLETAFPDRMPSNRDISLEDLRFQQGALSVVQFLRRQYDLQNTTTLPGA